MALRKDDSANLRNQYPISVQVGMVITLLILIAAFRIQWNPESDVEFVQLDQELVEMEEIEQTQQIEQPPPPPRPPVPIEVPDDELLDDAPIDFDAELDQDVAVDLPPPPPAQEEEEEEPEIFMVVEEMPELIGGLESLQRNIRYPEMAKRAGVEGTVFVQFVVDEEGNVVDPVVVRGIGAGCDEEALRAVSEAKFEPGRQRGQPVKVRFSLPIRFRLR